MQTTTDPNLNYLRQRNAEVASNLDGKDVNIGGAYLYGAVKCNGGTPKVTQNVTGSITNNHFSPPQVVPKPTWTSNYPAITSVTKVNMTLASGNENNPARYKLSEIMLDGNTLSFTPHGQSGQGHVEIWVTKDVGLSGNAKIDIPADVKVTMYIEGKFSGTGFSITNRSARAENLTIYGVSTPDKSSPQWAYNSDADFIGTINGPDVKFKVTGIANFFGAVIVNTVDFGGSDGAGFHFDEALLNNGGATPRYQVASWIEDVR